MMNPERVFPERVVIAKSPITSKGILPSETKYKLGEIRKNTIYNEILQPMIPLFYNFIPTTIPQLSNFLSRNEATTSTRNNRNILNPKLSIPK